MLFIKRVYCILLSFILNTSILSQNSIINDKAIINKTSQIQEQPSDFIKTIIIKAKGIDEDILLTMKEYSLLSPTIRKNFLFNEDLPTTIKSKSSNIFISDSNLNIKANAVKKSSERIYDSSNTNKLEFVQFTDFLGFENDRPNGLLQQEFRFKWALNRRMRPIGNRGVYTQFFRSLVFPDILLNRIDKSKQELDYSYTKSLPGTLGKDSGIKKLTTMDILRYTNFQVAARLVIFALHTKHYRVHLQTGARLFRNRPFYTDTVKTGIDSGKVRSDFRAIYSLAPNIEVYAKVLNIEETGVYMDMILGVMQLRLLDSYYAQYDAAVVDEFNRATTIIPVTTFPKRRPSPIWYISTRLAKDWGEENSNSIFFRVNYYRQTGEHNVIVRQPPSPQPPVFSKEKFHNHFMQLQLGVSLGLDNLFKPKGEQKQDGKKSSENSF